jgi:hypothetical protein
MEYPTQKPRNGIAINKAKAIVLESGVTSCHLILDAFFAINSWYKKIDRQAIKPQVESARVKDNFLQ